MPLLVVKYQPESGGEPMFFRGSHDLEQDWKIIRNWLLISSLLLVGLCCYQPTQAAQAAIVKIDKLITIKTSNQTVTQQTAPLAGVHYQLQAVTPTNSQRQPQVSDPQSYRISIGSRLFTVTLITDQAGHAIYRNDSLSAGYYLLSEQVSTSVPKPATPVLIYFADHGLAGAANDEFDYVPKSGLTSAAKSPATITSSPATGNSANELGPNAKIMQSSGHVLPSWLILVFGGTFLLAIGGVVFKPARQKNS